MEEPSTRVPLPFQAVEIETPTGIVRRYVNGLWRWHDANHNPIEPPKRWRFILGEPPP
jgi:hypothetical protein